MIGAQTKKEPHGVTPWGSIPEFGVVDESLLEPSGSGEASHSLAEFIDNSSPMIGHGRVKKQSPLIEKPAQGGQREGAERPEAPFSGHGVLASEPMQHWRMATARPARGRLVKQTGCYGLGQHESEVAHQPQRSKQL